MAAVQKVMDQDRKVTTTTVSGKSTLARLIDIVAEFYIKALPPGSEDDATAIRQRVKRSG